MAQSLNVGIVGFGFAASTFHAPLICSVPGLRLSAISTRDAERARVAYPDVTLCSSPEELFARPELDVVIIPTPNSTHYPLARAALRAGLHVVLDKPFTLTVDEAEDLILTAVEGRLLLSVFHNRRWDADFLSVQEVLRRNVLGRVTHFESHMDRFRPQVRERWRESKDLGAGLWYDLGPHLLDQCLLLWGEPQGLTLHLAQSRDGAVCDDWFHAILDYGSLRAVLHASVVAANPAPRFLIHGLEGSYLKRGMDLQEEALKAGLRPGDEIWGYDSDDGILTKADGSVESLPTASGSYEKFYLGLRDALRDGTPPPVLATEALTVMRWLEAGRQSAALGRIVTKQP